MSDPEPIETLDEGDPAAEARRWLLEVSHGVLGTLSTDRATAGYPFLSVVPFALDARGRPLLQLADIAAHTRNLRGDARGSLLVQQPATTTDPQSGWRLTLLGHLAAVADTEREESLARFVERVPRALEYEQTHGFRLYRLEVERVRFIGGFGRIGWLAGAEVLRDPAGGGLESAAPEAVAHMNADHAGALVEMCQGLAGFSPARAEMLSLDRAGFLVRAHEPERLCYFSFGQEIDAQKLRPAVIDVLQRARRARGGAR